MDKKYSGMNWGAAETVGICDFQVIVPWSQRLIQPERAPRSPAAGEIFFGVLENLLIC